MTTIPVPDFPHAVDETLPVRRRHAQQQAMQPCLFGRSSLRHESLAICSSCTDYIWATVSSSWIMTFSELVTEAGITTSGGLARQHASRALSTLPVRACTPKRSMNTSYSTNMLWASSNRATLHQSCQNSSDIHECPTGTCTQGMAAAKTIERLQIKEVLESRHAQSHQNAAHISVVQQDAPQAVSRLISRSSRPDHPGRGQYKKRHAILRNNVCAPR